MARRRGNSVYATALRQTVRAFLRTMNTITQERAMALLLRKLRAESPVDHT